MRKPPVDWHLHALVVPSITPSPSPPTHRCTTERRLTNVSQLVQAWDLVSERLVGAVHGPCRMDEQETNSKSPLWAISSPSHSTDRTSHQRPMTTATSPQRAETTSTHITQIIPTSSPMDPPRAPPTAAPVITRFVHCWSRRPTVRTGVGGACLHDPSAHHRSERYPIAYTYFALQLQRLTRGFDAAVEDYP